MGPESLCEARTKSNSLLQMSLISSEHYVRDKAKMKTRYGVKDTDNALLQLPLDLHR